MYQKLKTIICHFKGHQFLMRSLDGKMVRTPWCMRCHRLDPGVITKDSKRAWIRGDLVRLEEN